MKSLYGEHCFASWFGTMAVHKRQILLSTERAWNKEGVAWSQKWLPYHLPGGIRGWPAYEDRDRTRAIERWGIPQDVYAERTSISRISLNWNIQLSLSLAQHFLFETLFTRSRANIHLWRNIANFFLSVQRSIIRIFIFLFTNLIIYIVIWHIPQDLQTLHS